MKPLMKDGKLENQGSPGEYYLDPLQPSRSTCLVSKSQALNSGTFSKEKFLTTEEASKVQTNDFSQFGARGMLVRDGSSTTMGSRRTTVFIAKKYSSNALLSSLLEEDQEP